MDNDFCYFLSIGIKRFYGNLSPFFFFMNGDKVVNWLFLKPWFITLCVLGIIILFSNTVNYLIPPLNQFFNTCEFQHKYFYSKYDNPDKSKSAWVPSHIRDIFSFDLTRFLFFFGILRLTLSVYLYTLEVRHKISQISCTSVGIDEFESFNYDNDESQKYTINLATDSSLKSHIIDANLLTNSQSSLTESSHSQNDYDKTNLNDQEHDASFTNILITPAISTSSSNSSNKSSNSSSRSRSNSPPSESNDPEPTEDFTLLRRSHSPSPSSSHSFAYSSINDNSISLLSDPKIEISTSCTNCSDKDSNSNPVHSVTWSRHFTFASPILLSIILAVCHIGVTVGGFLLTYPIIVFFRKLIGDMECNDRVNGVSGHCYFAIWYLCWIYYCYCLHTHTKQHCIQMFTPSRDTQDNFTLSPPHQLHSIQPQCVHYVFCLCPTPPPPIFPPRLSLVLWQLYLSAIIFAWQFIVTYYYGYHTIRQIILGSMAGIILAMIALSFVDTIRVFVIRYWLKNRLRSYFTTNHNTSRHYNKIEDINTGNIN